MNTHRIRPFNRILIAIAALGLGALLTVPIWRIDLMAPQYPEGLYLQIFHDRFDGDVRNINGLNHYIGMAKIENEMFPEFGLMKYAFGLLVGWGLIAAITGRNPVLFTWLLAIGAFLLWAMWDMYNWGYNYGHNLDPHAAIQVEGMAYQPPLIGHKKLLNFDAWSTPDIGGWILFAVALVAGLVWFVEWRWPHGGRMNRKSGSTTTVAAMALLFVALFSGCAVSGPPVLDMGKVECEFCRMNVMDAQFAAAIVTLKGRTYAFDSPECMVNQVADMRVAEEQIAGWWVSDHAHPGTLIDATKALYLASPEMHSPMNGDVGAFANEADRAAADAAMHGTLLDWKSAREFLTQ